MEIFISYARVDKPVCIQIVNVLAAHNVWYDQRLYAGQHWWREIVRRLEWCDVFIYLLSKDSIKSPYCQKELEIAKRLDKTILPILIEKTVTLPDHLDELHYIDMVESLDADNVSMLHNSILAASPGTDGKSQTKVRTARKPKTEEFHIPVEQSGDMISKAANAFESGNYDQAILLFKQAQAKGFKSRFINIEKMLDAAEQALEKQTRLRETEREYQQIVKLFQYQSMHEFACDAFRQFSTVYPNYDPQNLYQYCAVDDTEPTIEVSILRSEILPMLHWCEVPEGRVQLPNMQTYNNHIGEKTIRVPTFLISKYPVTNQQFNEFMIASDGYSNPRWWQASDYIMAWFEDHPVPLESRYEGDNRPRENVSWYEAIAFTRWLSHNTNLNITLPRIAQWQRAAQGDDNRFYPWGNIFNEGYCNTHESMIKSTTIVSQYEEGVSPFGVYDMSGNVWEWCADKIALDESSTDYKRAVLGGSFVSPADRAQISFRYFLKPEVRYSSIGFRLVCLPNKTNLTLS